MRRRLELTGAALVALGIVELVIVILVAKVFGWLLTLLVLLATTVVGLVLLRREGVRAFRRLREAVGSGRPPGGEVTGGFVGLVAAVLLVVPGLLSDLVGLVLLIPPVRRLGQRLVQRGTEQWISPAVAGSLFGPRRVKVRRGYAVRTPTPPAPPPDAASLAAAHSAIEPGATGAPIEGEIIDPS